MRELTRVRFKVGTSLPRDDYALLDDLYVDVLQLMEISPELRRAIGATYTNI